MNNLLIIVPGGLNTDITAMGVDRILASGELSLGGQIKIGPGGKARNMAQMAASFLGPGKVAMIGRTCRDPFNLWKIPLKALEEAGVDTSFVKVLDFEEKIRKFPGIALIPVDKNGKNQIYVLPGVNSDFCQEDINRASELFFNADKKKILILALEIPLPTVKYCLEKAAENGIRVILDPGGIQESMKDILEKKIFFIKPNEHEARILTGIKVTDFDSAEKAASRMLNNGIKNVLITQGAKGAYLFNKEVQTHIPVPRMEDTGVFDETGCGDQVTAIIAAGLAEGGELLKTIKQAVWAGTKQFHRVGINLSPGEKFYLFLREEILIREKVENIRDRVRLMLKDAGIVITNQEVGNIEVVDCGLNDIEKFGLQLVLYVNNDRYCAKEIVLFPKQIVPEHRHPLIDENNPGKQETFRCRWGELYLYIEGEPTTEPRAQVPDSYRQHLTVWKEIVLYPGDQYTLSSEIKHWFQAGPEGAIVSEFSSANIDDADIFTDPRIKRIPVIE